MEDECSVLAAEASQCCRCRRGRIHVNVTYHMTALVPLLVLLTTFCRVTNAMCPTRCQCNDDELLTTCSGAGLQVVPIQLNPELRHVNLSYNKINSVHFTLEIYAQLISLDVSYNKIQKLGSFNFMSQSQLQAFNISNNVVENLDKDVFKGLKSLKLLDLSSNFLEDISINAFTDLISLEILFLTNNRIMSFEPESFKRQTNLRILQLDDNQLLEIPYENLVYMTKLEELHMSRNLVEYIEENSFPNLKFLRYLILDTNVITEIHDNSFDNFALLEVLNLADNNFTLIPTVQLSKLSNLNVLNLSGNFFNSIPPVAFRGLFKLRQLYLNGVETLRRIDTRAFVDNINLERISLDNNIDLTTIPTRLFHGNPRLTHISIRNNMLQILEASHFPLDQLRTLQIADNPLYCNCSLLWLWKLVTEQRMLRRNIITENGTILDDEIDNEMELDIDGIKCAGPEKLYGILLVDVPESETRCSPNWVAVATGSGVVVCMLAIIFVLLLYTGVLKRLKNKNLISRGDHRHHHHHHHHPPINQESPVQERQVGHDKCENVNPPLFSEYQTLPTWESYGDTKKIDLYRQFGYPSNLSHPSRPHVVYV